ncbi:hypothetical protein [Streptomyces sp. NPDC091371]|uniref:hypothetical protein n=1 Tax=Streptomyces sp. NPDC091371 TaxID=3155303 RepID=UPI00343E2FF3
MPRQILYPELAALSLRTSGLSHLKQNVLMTYAIYGGMAHSVEVTAAELAGIAGVPAPHFSRTRRDLVAEGWLEFTHKEGQIKFFRLGVRATGRRVVVPLKRVSGRR